MKTRSGGISKQRRQAPVFQGRVISKKKQKQLEKAVKLEKRLLHQKGYLEAPEEDMQDANALVPSQKQKVIVEISAEALKAAASGRGTTLGQPL
ncbi:hypothetical protein INT45_003993 [Circinella minor]|uniref:Uncharacterized protein n=1 Tax=Circinella minor TaxID=1195481 RepID=A0A8H7RTP9_9FUNG|nr:hypothetical protein INT45_003993 [Circinella minor]